MFRKHLGPFLEGDNGAQGGNNNPNPPEADKTFSQEEVNQLIGKTKSKMEASFKETLDAQKEEWKTEFSKAQEFAQLSDQEKLEKEKAEREEAISKREKDITMREYKLEVKEQLVKEELSPKFVDLVTNEDPKKTQQNIDLIKELMKEGITKGVEVGLASYNAKSGGSGRSKESSIGKKYAENANKANTIPDGLWK